MHEVLRDQIQPSKFKDWIGFFQRLMDWMASHWVKQKAVLRKTCTKQKPFMDQWTRPGKKGLFQAGPPPFRTWTRSPRHIPHSCWPRDSRLAGEDDIPGRGGWKCNYVRSLASVWRPGLSTTSDSIWGQLFIFIFDKVCTITTSCLQTESSFKL